MTTKANGGSITTPSRRTDLFVTDTLTAVDIQMSFVVEASMTRADGTTYRHISAFVDRIRKLLPTSVLERGGEYTI